MPQSKTLHCRGLYSFVNNLSEIPDGALVEADNVVIDRDGIITPRRGLDLYGTALTGGSSVRSKQLLTYKGRILRHYSTKLEYDSNGTGTFVAFNDITASAASVTEPQTGLRIKAVEQNGNLYFTSSAGIKKISAASAATLSSSIISDAGGIKALDGIAELNTGTGFLTQDSTVAYRIVWGITDANNNLILGYPSERIVIVNSLLSLIISDFNRLLTSLDTAAASGGDTLSNTDYNTLTLSANASSVSVHNALKSLCQKLDADMTVTTYYNGGGSPSIYFTYATAPSNPATTTQLLQVQAFYDAIVDALLVESVANISQAAQTAGNFQNSTQSSTVDLTFTVPSGVTTSHLYQIYRTPLTSSTGATFLSDLDPGDEMRLAFEGNPTAGEITAKEITLTDITPESFLGANLYTNANSGEGILQANEVPPLAKDVGVFKNTVFYANTKTKHRKQFSLLSATGLTNYTFTIALDGGSSFTYTFRDTVKTTSINCIAASSLSVFPTASDYFDIYSAGNQLHYRFWYNVDGLNTAPAGGTGITVVQIAVLGTDSASDVASKTADVLDSKDEFTASAASAVVTVVNTGTGTTNAPTENVVNAGFTITIPSGKDGSGEDASTRKIGVSNADTPAQAVDETARSLVRIINKQASENVIAQYISGPDDVPGAISLETKSLGTNAFSLTVSNAAISAKFNPTLPTSGTTVSSDNEISPNRVYYSKVQQPEAVPLLNYLDVGAKDKVILRIVPLRDSLFIFKEDGIYRLSGDSGNFSATLFDSSTNLRAADTAATLNNEIYMIADQGVVKISDTGVGVISRQIENLILPLDSPSFAAFSSASFGVGYESDRAYLLWTVKNMSDTVASQCFRFNTFTNTWTNLPISKTCGVVNPSVNKLYTGAGDTNYIEQERKSFSRLDHADRETAITFPASAVSDTTLSLGGLFGIQVGDAIVQTQYLTIRQFNRLLKKLDTDNGVADSNYYSSLGAVAGDNLGDKLVALCAKLNADTGVTDTNYTATATTVSTTNQTEFNTIVTKLNNDAGIALTTYRQSSGTVVYEASVIATNSFTNKITIAVATNFVAGAASTFKRIETKVTWAPMHFGDPTLTKQVRESTILFETQSFSIAEAAFSSDLSPGFETIAFTGEGNGTFGSFNWGYSVFGGDGSSRPFRTYVPREKQRCRFINCQFSHAVAFEQFNILGVSFTYEPVGSRGYR